MQQELARVLAWAWASPDSPYHGMQRMREYALAAIRFHCRIIHSDGSLDDYFPFERALGATGYALAALTDACRLLQWEPDAPTRKAMLTTAAFLSNHNEAGTLSNHHAIATYALASLGTLCADPHCLLEAHKKAQQLLALQHDEGWFPEYEGCDLGYQTVTLEFMARAKGLDASLIPSDNVSRLLRFIRAFAHPDGSFGGEYGSRNTYNFYPGGFALYAEHHADAREMLGLLQFSIQKGTENHLEDDGVFGHMLSSWITVLQARDNVTIPHPETPDHLPPSLTIWPNAGLFTGAAGTLRIFGNTTKGGCYKIFNGPDMIASDTGFAGTLADGTAFCQNKPRASVASNNDLSIQIAGRMQRFQSKRLTKISLLGLRALCLLFGNFRSFSSVIRIIMQKMLIYNKKSIPITFTRQISIHKEDISIEDSLQIESDRPPLTIYRTTDCINMHVITSDAFQASNLMPWKSITAPDEKTYSATLSFTSRPDEQPHEN